MFRFQTTRWSVVLEAREDPHRARLALEELCRTYRAPVLAYIRGRGHRPEDAEDLAQAFFTVLIEQALHAHADPARGRFRAFLLTALKNFLSNAIEHAQAQKRGGGVQFRSLGAPVEAGVEDGAIEIRDDETPDQVFERAWAQAALRAAMRRLQVEAAAAGRSALFDRLCGFLIERPDEAEYARVAAAFNIQRNTIAVSVHRLRRRLRDLVRDELADTAADGDALHHELHQLRHSLAVAVR